MFQRFTEEARAVVVEARSHALRLSHGHIGTEHILLAIVTEDPLTSELLAQVGVNIKSIELELNQSGNEKEGPVESDRDALGELGIDLDQVKAAVESTFGHRALDRARSYRSVKRRQRRRNRQCADAIAFTPSGKKALEMSLREAVRLKHRRIGPEHVALGLLLVEEGLARRILRRQGVAMRALRESLEGDHGRAA